MASYNRVILAGNLTRDPEHQTLPSGAELCKFGMAVNRKWRDQGGEQKEETCFVDCTLFGKQVHTFCQFMSKGSPVLVEGRLHYSTWQAQDGAKRSKLEVVVERFQFLGGRDETSPAISPPGSPKATQAAGW